MKKSIKKALSLIVVLVMLLTMIPAGMISVSADEAPTIDLGNYDTAEEYVIMNLADWELIAASDKDFAGIVVKLGADLNAGGYTELLFPERFTAAGVFPRRNGGKPTSGFDKAKEFAPTFPTLFKEFAGTFDGQGHTIKNARVNEALIAAITLDGAEIKNVIVEDIVCSDFTDYVEFGIIAGAARGSVTFDNITIQNSSVPCDNFNSMSWQTAGGLLGYAQAAEGVTDALLTITNCQVINTDVAAGGTWAHYGEAPHGTGLLVGTIDTGFDTEVSDCLISGGRMVQYENYLGTFGQINVGKDRYCEIENITIEKCYFDIHTAVHSGGTVGIGPLIGLLSPYDYSYVGIDKINVVDCYVTSKVANIGGLIGTIQSVEPDSKVTHYTLASNPVIAAEINISNIYTNAVLHQLGGTATNPERYTYVGGLISQCGEGDSSGDNLGRFYRGDVNIYNCYIESTVIAGCVKDEVNLYEEGAGGVFGVVSMAGAEIYLSDTIVDAAFPHNKMLPTMEYSAEKYLEYNEDTLRSVGVIAYAGHTRLKAAVPGYTANDSCDPKYKPGADKFYEIYLHVDNVITTVQGEFVAVAHNNRKGGIHYNGVDIGCGDHSTNKVTNYNRVHYDAGIAQVLPAEAKQMVAYDANGYVDMIFAAASTSLETVKVSASEGGKVNIRFIGFAAIESADAVGATVMIGDRVFTFDSVALLDEVNAANGIAAHTTKDFGAQKLMAVTVKNVPLPIGTKLLSLKWSFNYTIDGRVVTGNSGAGTLATDGSLAAVVE